VAVERFALGDPAEVATRVRALAPGAASVADAVAALLREELGASFDAGASAASFKSLAAHYLTLP
jgi:hypothetical protein